MKYKVSTFLAILTVITLTNIPAWEETINSKAVTIELPTSAENIPLFFTEVAITFTQANDVVDGSTPSLTWNVEYAATRDEVSPTKLWTSDRVTTSESGAETTTFNNPNITGGQWVWITTSAQSGTTDKFNVTFTYTQ